MEQGLEGVKNSLINMQKAQILVSFCALVCATPAVGESQSDIVWPTYDAAQHVADNLLNCSTLGNETAHTAADITLLEHAKARVEEVLHSAFDMERYGRNGGPGGQKTALGSVDGKESYATARGQIVESLKIAHQRRDWLESLKPNCKPAP